jgi:hypothetical protein
MVKYVLYILVIYGLKNIPNEWAYGIIYEKRAERELKNGF